MKKRTSDPWIPADRYDRVLPAFMAKLLVRDGALVLRVDVGAAGAQQKAWGGTRGAADGHGRSPDGGSPEFIERV